MVSRLLARLLFWWAVTWTALILLIVGLTAAPPPARAEGDALRAVWEAQARAAGHEVNDRRYAEHVIRATWPAALHDWAIRTVACETGHTWDVGAYNPAGPYVGLFQVWAAHAPGRTCCTRLPTGREPSCARSRRSRTTATSWPLAGFAGPRRRRARPTTT